MINKTLGRTGLEVTQLGYGSMGIRGPKTWGVRDVSEEAADKFLNSVLDAGINFIDTLVSPASGVVTTSSMNSTRGVAPRPLTHGERYLKVSPRRSAI